MISKKVLSKLVKEGRTIQAAKAGEESLDLLKLLPGVWKNEPSLPGRGWNMIALPFVAPGSKLNYRLLLNQYNETLKFTTVDKGVPNRGIEKLNNQLVNSDQFVVALDYEQSIVQIAAEDFPVSGMAGPSGAAIHHEPGLFLQMANNFKKDLQIARLSTIPHGNSVLALGKANTADGGPTIPNESGLPIGVGQDLTSKYLLPYKHFHDNPFRGVFDPVKPNELLKLANQGVNIVRTTAFKFDTKYANGGILNIPFIEKQADASQMHATFWIQELAEKDSKGNPKLRLQYTQTVMLEFFKRKDGKLGRIKWPHVSINTLEKVS